MRRSLFIALTVAAAVLGVSSAASAAACFGTSAAAVCVEPANAPDVDPRGSSITQCVYAGGDECENVTIPVPTVELGSGPLVYCRPSCEMGT